MANVDKAFGLRPMGNLSATGAQKQYGYNIEVNQAGAIFQGDLVTLVGGYIVVFDATLHTAALGVFNGCSYIDPTSGKPTWSNYYPGSVNITTGQITAEVLDDPNQLFLIQADGVVSQSQVGLNAAIAYAAGSVINGISATEIDSTLIGSGQRVLKIVGNYTIPGNNLGEANVDVIVKINQHLYGSTGVSNIAPA